MRPRNVHFSHTLEGVAVGEILMLEVHRTYFEINYTAND